MTTPVKNDRKSQLIVKTIEYQTILVTIFSTIKKVIKSFNNMSYRNIIYE